MSIYCTIVYLLISILHALARNAPHRCPEDIIIVVVCVGVLGRAGHAIIFLPSLCCRWKAAKPHPDAFVFHKYFPRPWCVKFMARECDARVARAAHLHFTHTYNIHTSICSISSVFTALRFGAHTLRLCGERARAAPKEILTNTARAMCRRTICGPIESIALCMFMCVYLCCCCCCCPSESKSCSERPAGAIEFPNRISPMLG